MFDAESQRFFRSTGGGSLSIAGAAEALEVRLQSMLETMGSLRGRPRHGVTRRKGQNPAVIVDDSD